jgi:hypothetical protein
MGYGQVVLAGLIILVLLSQNLTPSSGHTHPVKGSRIIGYPQPILAAATLAAADTLPPADTSNMPTAKAPALSSSLEARPAKRSAQQREFTGTLAIQSEPSGAATFIDRKYVGDTPITRRQWRAGSHAVRIEGPGYRRWTAAIDVTADRLTKVHAMLQRESGR